MTECRCGCGETVPRPNKTFVNNAHRLQWMNDGGAREMNALLPEEVRVRGGQTAGRIVAESGKLAEAGLKGAEVAREVAERIRQDRR